MLGFLIAILLIGAIVGFAIRSRRNRAARGQEGSGEPPLDLTLLLREPRVLTREHLVGAVQRAFGRDLSGGGDEATEFALMAGTMGMVQVEGYAFPVICAPEPIVKDPGTAGEGITELRRRVLFAEHRAFVSVGCANRPEGASREEAYARMGRLVAGLVDDTALLLYSDETHTGALLNEDTTEALRSGDPLKPLRTLNDTSIGLISGEDPRMVEATAEARRRLPEFVAAFHTMSDYGSFLVKGPFTDGTHTEFMWVQSTEIAGETIRGTLMNEPFQVRGVRQGATVEVSFGAVSDWGYVGPEGSVGLFTERIVRGAMG